MYLVVAAAKHKLHADVIVSDKSNEYPEPTNEGQQMPYMVEIFNCLPLFNCAQTARVVAPRKIDQRGMWSTFPTNVECVTV